MLYSLVDWQLRLKKKKKTPKVRDLFQELTCVDQLVVEILVWYRKRTRKQTCVYLFLFGYGV